MVENVEDVIHADGDTIKKENYFTICKILLFLFCIYNILVCNFLKGYY